MTAFWLGVHRPHWLAELDVPMFVSHRQLAPRCTLPRAAGSWVLDSGGFTEIDKHGRWTTSVDDYVAAVGRYEREIGKLAWAAPMDWMCEEAQLEKTGLTVEDHQRLTVANFLELRGRGPFIPVLQGWEIDDYARCVAMYADAGVDLEQEPLVGVGSICKRESAAEIGRIIVSLQPLRLHGFGVKIRGLQRYGHLLSSADSMSWSMRAAFSPPLPGCTHRNCANCQRYALRWRERIVRQLQRPMLFPTAVA
jgi:hypothetical protein